MQSEADEVLVNYFVLCDYVLNDANTGKQSLIGIYSALIVPQLPLQLNLAVGFGIRIQSVRPREFGFRFTGADGTAVFSSPPLPCDWNSLAPNLQQSGFATLQFGLNLQSVPFNHYGIYTATMYCDGDMLASCPLSVVAPMPG